MKFSEHYTQLMAKPQLDESFTDAIDKVKSFLIKAKDYLVNVFNTDEHLKEDIVKYFGSEDSKHCEELEKEIKTLIDGYTGVTREYFEDAFSHVKTVKHAQLKHEEAGYGDILNTVIFIRDLITQLKPFVGQHIKESTDEFVKLMNEIEKLKFL